jgi:hypothetical protein
MFLHYILKYSSLFVLVVATATAQQAADNNIAVTGVEQSIPDLQFKSAFSDYVPYSDQALQSWRQANDTVGEIGGWKTYAKEASQPDSSTATPSINDHKSVHPESKGVN